MSKIQALRSDMLSETPTSPGIVRHLAFKGEGFLVARSRSNPGTVSGWHHHGEYDVYGYLVSGSARLESDRGEEIISLSPVISYMFLLIQSTAKSILPPRSQTSSSSSCAEQDLWLSTRIHHRVRHCLKARTTGMPP